MYNVERRDRPGETLDPEAMLSRYEEGTEFYIARQNSRRARGSEPKVLRRKLSFIATLQTVANYSDQLCCIMLIKILANNRAVEQRRATSKMRETSRTRTPA